MRTIQQHVARIATDIHGLLNPNINRFFKTKSLLRLLREADWVPDRVPDAEVPVTSALAMLHIGQTKHVTDPVTGQKVPENTELVKRARSAGMDDATIITMSSILTRKKSSSNDEGIPESVLAAFPERYKTARMREYRHSGSSDPGKGAFSSQELLEVLKFDLISDVSGEIRPVSSLNYVWVTARFMSLFLQIEDELKRRRNPLWVQAYEGDPLMTREKILSLTALALAEEDEECMEVIAEEFQSPRAGFISHVYWDDLGTSEELRSSIVDDKIGSSCTVM